MDYMNGVLKTLANAETFEHFVENDDLQQELADYARAANALEQRKKQIAYGKNLPESPAKNPVAPVANHVLHAKLGIAGESGEVLEAATREEVKNEVGDLLWYVAVLLNEHGLTFEETMQGNLDKLAKKYSTGVYTREEALMGAIR